MIDNEFLEKRWPEQFRKLDYGILRLGYMVDPENRKRTIPDPEQVEWIEKGFDYLDAGSSLREVAEWLEQKLKRTLSHQTLSSAYARHRRPWSFHKTKKKRKPTPSRETRKLIGAKVTARHAVRRAQLLEKEQKEKAKKLQPTDFDEPRKEVLEPIFKDAPMETKIVFQPNPGPQSDFLRANEEEVLYGGGAGGGKSYALLADPMRYFHNPNFVGLLLRHTNDELRELKWESMKLYPKAYPGAIWKEKDSMWVFPSGAKLWMTYLERDEDVMRYQGQAFCWIGFDELTHYATPFAWQYLKSRLRSTDSELKKHLSMRATTNPGGPGHQWVKKMFVDPATPGKSFWATDIDTGEVLHFPDNHSDPDKAGKPLFKRRFIPAFLKDNPYLHDDGIYERSLQGLPEAQRRKLLDGDWSVTEGAAFPEFNPTVHVCEPMDIPESWRKFRSGDFGYSSYSAILWFAIDPMFGTLYVYRELYVSKKTGAELANMIIQAERGESISYGVLDSSVWHQRGNFGPTIAEEMIALGCRWRPSDRGSGSRIAGKNRLHEILKVDEFSGKPGIMFFNTCRQIIADLPTLPSDPDGGEDIDLRFKSDHTYDALRYGIMSRPKPNSEWEHSKTYNTYQPVDKQFGY